MVWGLNPGPWISLIAWIRIYKISWFQWFQNRPETWTYTLKAPVIFLLNASAWQWMMDRPRDDGQTIWWWPDCSYFEILKTDLSWFKTEYFIWRVCRTYTTFWILFVETYQECVESYTTLLISLVKSYPEHVETYTPLSYAVDKAPSISIVI